MRPSRLPEPLGVRQQLSMMSCDGWSVVLDRKGGKHLVEECALRGLPCTIIITQHTGEVIGEGHRWQRHVILVGHCGKIHLSTNSSNEDSGVQHQPRHGSRSSSVDDASRMAATLSANS